MIETALHMVPKNIASKREKDTLGIETDNYDSFVISAGQDNVGKILGSVISILRYKEKTGKNYKGALMLIDEADVTLHQASQRKLAEFLINVSRQYNIQIILTTHSLNFISCFSEHHTANRDDIKTWLLYAPHGTLIFYQDPPIDLISSSINLLLTPKTSHSKIRVYAEDDEAILFMKNLLDTATKNKINLIPLKAGCNDIRRLSRIFNTQLPSIWVLDGDQNRKQSDRPSLIILPGGDSIEKCMRNFLDILPEDDTFWTETQYTKQHFQSNVPTLNASRKSYKRWFNEERANWGRGMSRLYKRWKKENEDAVQKFKEDMIQAYNATAKMLHLPPI